MKKIATALLIAVSIAAAPLRASAAIPVVDVENIAQQLKTYLETVKLVTNTAEQIQMQLLELKSLPERLITKYKNELLRNIFHVNDRDCCGCTQRGGSDTDRDQEGCCYSFHDVRSFLCQRCP